MYKMTKISPLSGRVHTMTLDITEQQLFDYERGRSGLIQNAFPRLTAGEREFIMTGITDQEWQELFADNEG